MVIPGLLIVAWIAGTTYSTFRNGWRSFLIAACLLPPLLFIAFVLAVNSVMAVCLTNNSCP